MLKLNVNVNLAVQLPVHWIAAELDFVFRR